jgi:hypothetical protein
MLTRSARIAIHHEITRLRPWPPHSERMCQRLGRYCAREIYRRLRRGSNRRRLMRISSMPSDFAMFQIVP